MGSWPDCHQTSALCIYATVVLLGRLMGLLLTAGKEVSLTLLLDFGILLLPHPGSPCLALIHEEVHNLLQVDMPCLVDNHKRPALCWMEMEEEDTGEWEGGIGERN